MKSKVFIIVIICTTIVGLFAFQNKDKPNKKNTLEEAVEEVYQAKINKLELQYASDCRQDALKKAIPIADSLIAEMYAKGLRAQDQILQRPEKPEMPSVEIPSFPFDSIE